MRGRVHERLVGKLVRRLQAIIIIIIIIIITIIIIIK